MRVGPSRQSGEGRGARSRSSLILVGFAAMLWLVVREEVPANQRDMVTLLLGTLAGMASSAVAYWIVHGGAAGNPRFALLVSRACPLAGLAQSARRGLQQRVNSDPTDSWSARHKRRRARQISGAGAPMRSWP